MLAKRLKEEKGQCFFPGRRNKGVPIVKVNNGHAAALRRSGVRAFRLYDLRHTWATHGDGGR